MRTNYLDLTNEFHGNKRFAFVGLWAEELVTLDGSDLDFVDG